MTISFGAVCFGIVVGFITYRTLIFKEGASIGDISAVIGAVGGGVVTVWSDQGGSNSFAWYSIGLLIGFGLYYAHTSWRGGVEQIRKLAGADRGTGLPKLPGLGQKSQPAGGRQSRLGDAPHGTGLPELDPEQPETTQQ